MDKSVIFSVAGSGKTSHLVSKLNDSDRFLIVTYTQSNCENLRLKIIQRFGYFPQNITLYTYFKFLHGFCYKPFLRSQENTRGLTFKQPPRFPLYKMEDERRYLSASRHLYSNRLAKFIERRGLLGDVIARMEKYFDVFFVDEVQDLAGHDFNFLMAISAARLDMTFVGDFYQHTFDTSRDGNVNQNLHSDYEAYKSRFRGANLRIDTESLKKSRRCSKSVCDFITAIVGIPIESDSERETLVQYVDDPEMVLALYRDPRMVKLFYREHHKYGCYSHNWGASKGVDQYDDVCVVLNPSNVKELETGNFIGINTETRNKLYVACSRARGDLFLVPEALLKSHKQV